MMSAGSIWSSRIKSIAVNSVSLPVGHYFFIAIVGTHIIGKNLAVAPFQVVTPQFPAGVLTAVATPMAALGGFWLLAKRKQPKI